MNFPVPLIPLEDTTVVQLEDFDKFFSNPNYFYTPRRKFKLRRYWIRWIERNDENLSDQTQCLNVKLFFFGLTSQVFVVVF